MDVLSLSFLVLFTDTYEAHKNFTVAQVPRIMPKVAPVVDNDKSSDIQVSEITLNRNGVLGTGLKNEAGEYNCFLNVIIQVGIG